VNISGVWILCLITSYAAEPVPSVAPASEALEESRQAECQYELHAMMRKYHDAKKASRQEKVGYAVGGIAAGDLYLESRANKERVQVAIYGRGDQWRLKFRYMPAPKAGSNLTVSSSSWPSSQREAWLTKPSKPKVARTGPVVMVSAVSPRLPIM